jgi:hypothetical protein
MRAAPISVILVWTKLAIDASVVAILLGPTAVRVTIKDPSTMATAVTWKPVTTPKADDTIAAFSWSTSF